MSVLIVWYLFTPACGSPKVAFPKIYPHLIPWMTFRILPTHDLSVHLTYFLLASCSHYSGVFSMCQIYFTFKFESLSFNTTSAKHSLAVSRKKRNKQSKAEINTLTGTHGLVLKPAYHLETWMGCTVIGAKNTSHTLHTLYPWHVHCGVVIITLINDRLSMNPCWKPKLVGAYCMLLL